MDNRQEKGAGRPRTGRTTERIFPSLPKKTIAFIEWRIGEQGSLSAYLDERVKSDPRYPLYEEWLKQQKGEQ
jgi:hypothetical protein